MAEINVLPKEIYQLIAAGEVVERPSSVVKEMIENSVDAGAKHITVEIKNGGTTYIRITDDGCGIEKNQVRKVFIPHATSKISQKSDLDAISTLGFRGEAMASVCAVAKVELITKSKDETIGTRYEIHGGEEVSIDDAGCPQGTTIAVRDIFYNTPARMKFLKKDVTEGNAVAGVVDRMALSHPEISFRFIRDSKQTLITSGNGDLKSTIFSVFGREVSDGLIPVEYSYSSMRITGFASKPISSRKSRAMQFFFINGRLVKSSTAMAALEQAYKDCVMTGRYPMCVLNIELNPATVDVNVHPAKIEVRFSNERPVFDLVYYGVKSALAEDSSVKQASFDFKSQSSLQNGGEKSYSAHIDFFKKKDEPPIQQAFRINDLKASVSERSVLNSPEPDFFRVLEDEKNGNEEMFKNEPQVSFKDEKPEITETQGGDNLAEKAVFTDVNDKSNVNFNVIGEAFKTYIIVEIENELFFIDKHAAHERMNYERFKAGDKIESQLLLSPVAVNLSKDEFNQICDNMDLLNKCGFEAEPFGDSTVLVRSIPSLAGECAAEDLITEIAQKLTEHKTDITPEKIDWIYHSASCRGAVKAGDSTSPEEQRLFVEKLLSMPEIRFCPHGRPVFIKLSKYDIEKQFGRVQ